ncbi:recombinase family protein [Xenorhabdus ishibashii]|uniref:Resolvase family site-specific recombinase n=1 Tax=Xenorhabdus ishibashii TaxID=1034471 RepID=A0A2D0KGE0_9GAMM|nr:recombinase family protein [Xenorhabdus ishibashii]PHM62510.1 resolvase family site-specific recombinase [Xenorhabdus ishibashii]
MEKKSSNSKGEVIFAAEYVRMSTEHQKYSQDNQSAYIHDYANKHGITIIHTYNDAGKSGLNLTGRTGLRSLIDDVINHKINISALLVYDVSRFGRFQDADEAGHYAYLLKMHGVNIIYCAEPFSREQSEMYMLGMSFSRYSAASYSRNLSEKVFLGQVNLIKKGFHQGGMAGYGLRRLLIDEHRNPKGILEFGQRKSIHTDRVILIPGPQNEVDIVNLIFYMFIQEGKPELVIASELNRKKIFAENGTEWTRGKIHQILTNEKYIGNNVYNKTSFKLKQRYIINPEEEWIRCNGAYEPIVSHDKFNQARDIIKSRSLIFTEDELLEKLHTLLQKKGRLSGLIIDEEELLPSSSVYRSRFGSLLRVYKLVGYDPKTDYSWLETKKYLKGINAEITESVINNIYLSDGWISDPPEKGILNVNDEFTLTLQAVRCQRTSPENLRWRIKFDQLLSPDISIAIRMDSLNQSIVDYYIFPSIDVIFGNHYLRKQNPFSFELYRFDTLHPLYQLIKRTTIQGEKNA